MNLEFWIGIGLIIILLCYIPFAYSLSKIESDLEEVLKRLEDDD